jgi:Holliday junction resolvasome RuvABC DNA-binding subunit
MRNQSKKILDDYFEQLKASIPSSDQRFVPTTPGIADKLVDLVKQSLTVIEAVYLQNPEMFPLARVEEYHRVIQALQDLGFDYQAHQALIQRAATGTILSSRLPMKKAKTTSNPQDEQYKAG